MLQLIRDILVGFELPETLENYQRVYEVLSGAAGKDAILALVMESEAAAVVSGSVM